MKNKNSKYHSIKDLKPGMFIQGINFYGYLMIRKIIEISKNDKDYNIVAKVISFTPLGIICYQSEQGLIVDKNLNVPNWNDMKYDTHQYIIPKKYEYFWINRIQKYHTNVTGN